MRETDDHFSAAQLAAISKYGLSLADVPRRRVALVVPRAISIAERPGLPHFAERRPLCPILDADDKGDLIVLPDGTERWVQR